MTKKHTKSSLTSLVIREIQLKPQWKNVSISLETLKIKKPKNTKKWQVYGTPFIAGKIVKSYNHFRKLFGNFL